MSAARGPQGEVKLANVNASVWVHVHLIWFRIDGLGKPPSPSLWWYQGSSNYWCAAEQ